MANKTIVKYHELGEDKLDIIFTTTSVSLGVPGNILIFLAFKSYPSNASKFLFQFLAISDLISLVLLFSQRPLMWFDILQFEHKRTTTALTVYLNIIYYISIFTNMILVFLALERLLRAKFPSSYGQYFGNLDRVKLTLIIEGLLIMSFCLIITIKMSYFGLAWTVIFLTFYVVAPSFCLLACVLLLALHYLKKCRDKKYLEMSKPLTASHSSFVERSSSHQSGISASGTLKGSTSSSIAFKGKKKDPYSLYLFEKSASESHLATKSTPKHNGNPPSNGTAMSKSKSGNCVNTVVSLKVPSSTSYLSIHKTLDKTGTAGGDFQNFMTHEHDEEQLRRKKTRNKQMTLMIVAASIIVIVSCVPLTACAGMLMQEDRKDFDLSDKSTYILISAIMLSMYIVHSCKFFLYCLMSSIFRHHVMAVIRCRQQQALEEEQVPLSTAN